MAARGCPAAAHAPREVAAEPEFKAAVVAAPVPKAVVAPEWRLRACRAAEREWKELRELKAVAPPALTEGSLGPALKATREPPAALIAALSVRPVSTARPVLTALLASTERLASTVRRA